MTTASHSMSNRQKLAQLRKAMEELLAVALKRGFHGTVGVEVYVHDGTIQRIHRKLDHVEK